MKSTNITKIIGVVMVASMISATGASSSGIWC